jgi:hypothetical protein
MFTHYRCALAVMLNSAEPFSKGGGTAFFIAHKGTIDNRRYNFRQHSSEHERAVHVLSPPEHTDSVDGFPLPIVALRSADYNPRDQDNHKEAVHGERNERGRLFVAALCSPSDSLQPGAWTIIPAIPSSMEPSTFLRGSRGRLLYCHCP